ncbi:MAG: hypothetical protein DHS80DRAFT_2638, partial [Piptocephalis tieghemiana]
RRHSQMDTFGMVKDLEAGGFTQGQASVIMRSIQTLVSEGTREVQGNMYVKSDLDNEMYLMRAALSELRTELTVHRRADTAALRASADASLREVDVLIQRVQEQVRALRGDIKIEMNTRKVEVREEMKEREMRVQEMHDRSTIRLGEVGREMEAIKWETTRNGLRKQGCVSYE